MVKEQALAAIKVLRAQINDEADVTANAEGWENEVCSYLDNASDVIEFPKVPNARPPQAKG